MRWFVCAAFASCAFLIPSRANAEDPVPVFQCVLSISPAAGGQLLVLKSFRDNGEVHSMFVSWEDNGTSDLVHIPEPSPQVFVSLRWPGNHRVGHPDEPFEWSQGSITINLLLPHYSKPEEEWRQVIVDRNESTTVLNQGGQKFLFLSPLDAHLVSEPEPNNSPGRFDMALDSFLAWGSGARRVTVYETGLKVGRTGKHSSPLFSTAHRVVSAYDVDIPALAKDVTSIRETVTSWETRIAGAWRQCRHTVDGGHIVVN
jgi:hypothetical protein